MNIFLNRIILVTLILMLGTNQALAQSLISNETEEGGWRCSQLELIAIIELNLCGKTEPSKTIQERLEECERVSGLTTEITPSFPVNRRVADLVQEAPPGQPLMEYVITSSQKNKDFFQEKRNLKNWYASLYQMVTAVELATYADAKLGKSLLRRIELLEKDILKIDTPPLNKNLAERVVNLMEIIGPSENQAEKAIEITARKWDWFLASSSSTGPSTNQRLATKPSKPAQPLRNGIEQTKSILTSKEFWTVAGTLAAGAAALGVLYLLNRHSNTTNSYYQPYERNCTGRLDCRKCLSCSSCPHCKTPTFVRPCGVYFRTRAIP